MSEEYLCCKKGWCDEPIEDPGKTGADTPVPPPPPYGDTDGYIAPQVVTISYENN